MATHTPDGAPIDVQQCDAEDGQVELSWHTCESPLAHCAAHMAVVCSAKWIQQSWPLQSSGPSQLKVDSLPWQAPVLQVICAGLTKKFAQQVWPGEHVMLVPLRPQVS